MLNETRNKIDLNRATTPPSLFGTARRIAYANKKYHSGTICNGVDKGSASIKLSGSPREYGAKRTTAASPERATKNP